MVDSGLLVAENKLMWAENEFQVSSNFSATHVSTQK
jgi:hypothetical protein